MPRAKMETAFLGATTVKILRGVSEHVAGWLIKALCDWIEDDVLPKEIPEECLGSWIAIRDESERIHEHIVYHQKNGSHGGRPPKKPNGNQTETKRKPNGNQTDTSENPDNSENGDISVEEKRKEESRTPASAREVRPPANPEAEIECPLDESTIAVTAHNRNLPPSEVEAWRNYYAAAGWRFRAGDTKPMTREQARRSLIRWADNAARFAARDSALRPKGGITSFHDPEGAAKTAAAVGLL